MYKWGEDTEDKLKIQSIFKFKQNLQFDTNGYVTLTIKHLPVSQIRFIFMLF